MKLIIDYGNTLTKVAFFKGNEMHNLHHVSNITIKEVRLQIKELEKTYPEEPITHAIISSVINDFAEINDFLKSCYTYFELNENLRIPIYNKYKSPNTLGNDRLAAVVGASNIFPSTNLLIIDAGTCITYDFINDKKEYHGGGISPGIDMRFKALNTFTKKLPLISRIKEAELIGNTTKKSIQSGVINGILAELDGLMDHYKQIYPSIKIIFTGGDVNYFDKQLKNNIFAVPNLVLLGLNDILNYNVEK